MANPIIRRLQRRPRPTARVGLSARQQDRLTALAMLTPLLLLLMAMVAYPFGQAVWMSLTDKKVGMAGSFIGLRNYIDLTHDPVFWKTARNSLTYTCCSVALKLLLGMALALVLNRVKSFRGLLRSVVLLPWVIPTAISALVWAWVFNDMAGVLNWSLVKIGVIKAAIPWLAHPVWSMVAIIAVNVWRGVPFFGISLLAGLQAIPADLYEAATIDGAGAAKIFRYVTLPALQNVIGITTLLSIIETLGDFQLVWILTKGGADHSTQVFTTLTFLTGFQVGKIGSAVAVSLFLLPLLVVLIFLVTRFISAQEE